MLSAAATDPYFQAKLTTEIEAYPEHESLIESKCLACHMPMGRRQAEAEGNRLDFQTVQGGESAYQDLAIDGVSCTVCHQVQPEGLGTEETFNGEFTVDTTTEKPDRMAFGPYEPRAAGIMQQSTGYRPYRGDHVENASLCGSCHTLYTPTLNDSGAIVGSFPEQTPYLEWQESVYAEDTPCQSCHMPAREDVKLSSIPQNLPYRSVQQHQFAGANPQIATIEGHDRGAEIATAHLRQYVDLRIESVERSGDTLRVTVTVESSAGHKFPAGFPSRRAWIHLRVVDESGSPVFESGAVDETGEIAGRDAPYEQHWTTIESEEQVQIYQSVMQDVDGEVTQTLLKADEYQKDNRIPPQGFEASTAHEDIRPVGAVTEDSSFGDGSDTITYVVETDAESPTVDAELLFQPVSYPFLSDQRNSQNTTVTEFLDAYESVEKTTVVDNATATVG
jgi:hypothetical protein